MFYYQSYLKFFCTIVASARKVNALNYEEIEMIFIPDSLLY